MWSATPLHESGLPGLDAAHMLWYLTVTEIITLAPGFPGRLFEVEIQSGDVAAGLFRPVPVGLARLAEWSGATLYRMAVMSVGAFAAAYTFSGEWPFALTTLPVVIAAAVLGCAMILLFNLQLGYATAWFGACAPLYWIWQKLMFIGGGLLVPLTLYPETARLIAEATPFAAILYAPGSLVFDPATARYAEVIGVQLFWLGLVALATWVVDGAATRRFLRVGV